MKKIPLTQGQFALVDDEDFERANQHKWCASKTKTQFYAVRGVHKADGRKTTQALHQFILGVNRVDHRDGNQLDNQRGNLRPATQLQNTRGSRRKSLGVTSQFRGVSWFPRTSRWVAHIKVNRRGIHLGYFIDEKDAARAYNEAATTFFGDFASLNPV